MSDAAITTVVSGLVQITVLVVGFLTLWAKLKYGVNEAKDSAGKAEAQATKAAVRAKAVEEKLDANTATTESVERKADTIVRQTNGTLDATRKLVEEVSERVAKLEEYNRDSAHRVLDAVNAMHLRLATMAAQQQAAPTPPTGGHA